IKLDTKSDLNWTPIPILTGHQFRLKLDTNFWKPMIEEMFREAMPGTKIAIGILEHLLN
ncbi:hypothetical protein KKC1_26070, partial [Calderihabitans maritimus]